MWRNKNKEAFYDPSIGLGGKLLMDSWINVQVMYRDRLKCLYMVARSLLLLLLTCSAWLWLGPA